MSAGSGDAVGAVLNGTWRLRSLIGEGGLAAVYEAEGLQGQGLRAIKLLHLQFQSSPAVVDRFYNEAKAVYALRHPHIAGVEAYAYAEDGSPYIVMELLRGMSVEEFLARHQPMPLPQAITAMRGVLSALGAAHAHNIVHRDLKPANLFLVQRGPDEPPFAKVLDFGIAKVIDLAGGMGSKTRTGALLGTPGYMSPEQVRDSKAVDARTDLWSAAVVFYELLTCQHPFGSADHLARMVAVLKDKPRPIAEVAPEHAPLQPFFDRGLARDPAQRFQSADEMDAALRAFERPSILPPGTRRVVPRTEAFELVPERIVSPAGGTPAVVPAAEPAVGARVAAAAAPQLPGPVPRAVSITPAPSAQTPAALAHGGAAAGPTSGAQPLPLGAPAAGPAVPAVGWERPSDLPAADVGARFSPVPLPHGGHGSSFAPVAGSARPGVTQVSGERPDGAPVYSSSTPQVQVVSASDATPRVAWWVALLVGLGCLALGVLIGYVLRGAR
ncbi:MAG: protein kinase [Polyangiaceae bacterium]|nr:protein kinase [Polyangiaceae bacterium]